MDGLALAKQHGEITITTCSVKLKRYSCVLGQKTDMTDFYTTHNPYTNCLLSSVFAMPASVLINMTYPSVMASLSGNMRDRNDKEVLLSRTSINTP